MTLGRIIASTAKLSRMTDTLYFCVDTGATHSRGRLYDAAGAALADAEDGPANASCDIDQTMRSLNCLWRKLNVGGDAADHTAAVLAIGGAWLHMPRAGSVFHRAPGFASVLAMSDGYAALIGAGGGRPGALITIGTGVAGHRLFADGTPIQRDGWGWITGDRGGGCWLGTRAVRHSLGVRDGIATSSVLSDAVMGHIGGTAGLRNGALSNLTPSRLAGFAPLVLEQATSGCAVAGRTVERASAISWRLWACSIARTCRSIPTAVSRRR
jgi:glucosamine kinase